jgi:hypothetical protein
LLVTLPPPSGGSLRKSGRGTGDRGDPADGGWLDVGKDYDGRRGHQRTTWLTHVPEGRLEVTADDASVARAAEAITRFADAWAGEFEGSSKHNEHALESRILRGAVPISVPSGPLELLRAPGPERVNWGSQFPTRWGMTPRKNTSGRYLDALLRQGSTPWAVEMKVEGPAGVTLYYRHAVAQAVLYREFIRQAARLAPWFDGYGLDHTACRAAVVVPEIGAKQQRWSDRLHRVCEVFVVELVTVPERVARTARLPE